MERGKKGVKGRLTTGHYSLKRERKITVAI